MSTIRHALLMSSSSIGNLLIRLFSVAMLARLVTPAEFGLVAYAMVVVSTLSLLAGLDLRDALIQRIAITTKHVRLATAILLLSGLLLTVITASTAAWLEQVSGMPGLAPIMVGLAVIILVQAVTAVPEALLIRTRRIGVTATALFAGFALGFTPVAILAGAEGWGASALVAGYVAQHTLVLAVMLWGLREYWGAGLEQEAAAV